MVLTKKDNIKKRYKLIFLTKFLTNYPEQFCQSKPCAKPASMLLTHHFYISLLKIGFCRDWIKNIRFVGVFIITLIFLFLSFFGSLKLYADDDFSFATQTDEEFNFDEDSFQIYDPLEKINRKIFNLNEILDQYFFEHVAKGYR